MYSVLLIGLGNISVHYDFINSEDKTLTHAKAFSENDSFYLIGGVDLEESKRNFFESKYKVKSFSSIDEIFLSLKPDVIVIATPTDKHYETFLKILKNFQPKAIICEKPISNQYSESVEIVNLCKNNNIKLIINYPRLTEPSLLKIEENIRNKTYELPLKGTIWYSKGLLNGGIHFVNLIMRLFGNVQEFKITEKCIYDYDIKKFAPSFKLCFEDASIDFISLDKQGLFINEMKFIFSNGILNYRNSGNIVEWFNANKRELIFSDKVLNHNSQKLNTGFQDLQKYFVSDLEKLFKNEANSLCQIDLALNTEKLLKSIYDLNNS